MAGSRSRPDVAIVISTFRRPWHLLRVLVSIACQQTGGVSLEVVVTDDGSDDHTDQVVREFARTVDFPVCFTTHPHTTYQLARCRNEGVAASEADYLIFLDGDCLIPPDHVAAHLRVRQPRTVWAGYCVLLDQQTTARISLDAVLRGEFLRWTPAGELARLARMYRRARWYQWLRHPRKPKLFGGNVGIWRSDYERVNGYDERFEGWGCEDDDLRLRLRRSGVRIRSILGCTRTYHLWHPPGPTTPPRWRDGANVAYLRDSINRPVYCEHGLSKYYEDQSRVTIKNFPSGRQFVWREVA